MRSALRATTLTTTTTIMLAIGVPVGTAAMPQTIPFRLQDNLVRVLAIVDGHPVSAVIDSGTGVIGIDRAVAAHVGIFQGQVTGSAMGAGKSLQDVRPVQLTSISVGSLRLSDVKGYGIDLKHLSRSAKFPIDILLGASLFENKVITVDYPGRRLTFSPSAGPLACPSPIPITITSGVPVVDVTLQATVGAVPIRLKMIVDLGTRHFAAVVGGRFLGSKAGVALLRHGTRQQVGTGVGGAMDGTVAQIADLQVGKQDFPGLEVAFSPNAPAFETGAFDGTLGVPLWQTGTITFDYAHRQLCLAIPG